MKDMRIIVNSISGHSGNDCYSTLTVAAECMRDRYLTRPQVTRAVYPEVAAICGVSPEAVAKAVARATADIWDYGDREQLRRIADRQLMDKPSPKELLAMLALYALHGQ